MLITSKGRYALRLMIYITAFGGDGGPSAAGTGADGAGTGAEGVDRRGRASAKISLREVSERERISLKYLEQLVRPLMAAGLLRSVRGKGGGYVLGKPASEIRAGDILRAAEGDRSAVACEGLEGACGRSDLCSTVRFWSGLEDAIDSYVDGVTLADLAKVPEIKLEIDASGLG